MSTTPTTPAPTTPAPPPVCPLSGVQGRVPQRPALAVKVENTAAAYPLAGLDKADIVYEELAEGGITRYLRLDHEFIGRAAHEAEMAAVLARHQLGDDRRQRRGRRGPGVARG